MRAEDSNCPPTEEVAPSAEPAPAPPPPPNLAQRLQAALLGAAAAAIAGLPKFLESTRSVAVSLATIAALGIVVALAVREIRGDGISIDPVIVELNGLKEPMTPELASQRIAKYLDAMQNSGVKEWHRLQVGSTATPIELQIPGVPFNLHAATGEIAAMFGIKRTIIKASIISRSISPMLVASVSLAGNAQTQATCEEYADSTGMERLLECISLNVMIFIKPLVAAAYVFEGEHKACSTLQVSRLPNESAVDWEHRLIAARREKCEFRQTKNLMALALQRGGAETSPWVPYIYGKVHLARAGSLGGNDTARQLSELDQAIGRFREAGDKLKDSPKTALAILFEAYVEKGVQLHQGTGGLPWSDDPNSLLQWRLYLAEHTFIDAERQLEQLRAQKAPPRGADAEVDARLAALEATLYYRQWMILAHRRTKRPTVTVASDDPREIDLLQKANRLYEAAAKQIRSSQLFMDWGNTLRALKQFPEAATAYWQAADLDPQWYAPRINLAIAYLDRVSHATGPASNGDVLVALGATSDYFGWVSGGDPLDGFLDTIEHALGNTADSTDLAMFKTCRPATPVGRDYDRLDYVAKAKNCVDQIVDKVSDRVISAPRLPNEN